MKKYLKTTLNSKQTIFFISYVFVALAIMLFLVFSQAERNLALGVLGLLVILPFFLINEVAGLAALFVARPMLDIISDYAIFSIQNISFNLASILGIGIFIWGVIIILKNKIKLQRIPLFWPWLAFFTFAIISSFFAESKSLALAEIIKLANVFIIYILVYDWIKSKADLSKFIRLIPLTIIVPSIFAIYQLIFEMGLNFGGLSNRLYGTFGHPNGFAFYLVIVISLLLIYWLADPYFKNKKTLITKQITDRHWPVLPLIIFLFILLLFTYTRGAWVGMIIFLAVLGIFQYRKLLFIGTVIVIGIAIIFPLLNNFTIDHYDHDLQTVPLVSRLTEKNEDADSWDWRVEMYQEMAPLALESPIFGSGLGSFEIVRSRTTANPYEALEAHNDYLRLAIETGIVGLILYIILIIFISIRTLQLLFYVKKNQPDYYLYAVGLIGLVAAIYSMSFADNLLSGTPVQWIFWASIAAILSIRKFSKN